ncbi:MAG: LysM peptidoglycan-binding domain-containing protein [Alphaproteobacteria bacterium]|nr:LysM peptidoglycan-binding domain-containing protein [Alphaproteobacteria bacterium]
MGSVVSNLHRTWALIVATVILSIAVLAIVVSHIRGLEHLVAELDQENVSLSERHKNSEAQNFELQARLAALEDEISSLQQPQPVDGPAFFPVSRVLARRGDTVAKLAKRESTTVETIFQLNTWLNSRQELLPGQAIWIPNQ